MFADRREDPRLRDVLLLSVGVGGLLLCVTLVFLGMRAVMDIGGACADGGPYVSAQSCPDGAAAALMLGVFGGFGFGALGAVYGAKVGGYAWVPLLGWTALFATLGWNFLDYGVFNAPEGEGIVWGWAIPGILFELMAWVPVWFLVTALWSTRGSRSSSSTARFAGAGPMRGPGQPARDAGDEASHRPPPVPAAHRVEVVGPVRRDELRDIDALMGALIVDAEADTPIDPAARLGATAPAAVTAPAAATVPRGTDPEPEGGSESFPEGTQALLDRLERVADMRDRGLLTPEDYETAKDSIMRELEARS